MKAQHCTRKSIQQRLQQRTFSFSHPLMHFCPNAGIKPEMKIPFGKDQGTGQHPRAPPVSLLGGLWAQPCSWPASPGSCSKCPLCCSLTGSCRLGCPCLIQQQKLAKYNHLWAQDTGYPWATLGSDEAGMVCTYFLYSFIQEPMLSSGSCTLHSPFTSG